MLGRLADQPGERDQGRRREDELRGLADVREVVERDRERSERKEGEENAADHGGRTLPAHALPSGRSPVARPTTRSRPARQVLRTLPRGCDHPVMPDLAPATTETARIPLRPQDEVECRRCEVHCDRVVYPGACVARSCPFVYAYEAWGHTYMGCLQKVFDVEIDLDLLGELEARREGFGAVKARRTPLPMCRSGISACYEHREDEVGCRNPEFFELPLERPSFRVFAEL